MPSHTRNQASLQASSRTPVAAETSPRTAAVAVDASSRSPATVDLAFIFRGNVDTLEGVSVRAKVSTLRDRVRKRIKEARSLAVEVYDIALFSLLQDDGSWPTEDEAPTAQLVPVVYSDRVGSEFRGALDARVHFAVKLVEGIEPAEDVDEPDAEEVAVTVDHVTVRNLASFKRGCIKHLSGSKRRLPDDDQEEIKHMAFSDFTASRIKRMYTGEVTEEDYDQPASELPQEVEKRIRQEYDDLVTGGPEPWHVQNEAQKRRFIDMVLNKCICAVNRANPTKEKLQLLAEYSIECPSIPASGCADWVVKRGDRMLVVIEAKAANIDQGQYQLLAMVEAIRIQNRLLGNPISKIKAICTDFQNWMFVEREDKVLRRDYNNMTWPKPRGSFPEHLVDICEQVYDMMLNL